MSRRNAPLLAILTQALNYVVIGVAAAVLVLAIGKIIGRSARLTRDARLVNLPAGKGPVIEPVTPGSFKFWAKGAIITNFLSIIILHQ